MDIPNVTPVCCRQHHLMAPRIRICSGRLDCRIRYGDTFMEYEDISLCMNCFKAFKVCELPKSKRVGKKKLTGVKLDEALEKVTSIVFGKSKKRIPLTSFTVETLLPPDVEPTVECSKCRQHSHLACVLQFPVFTPNEYLCSRCQPKQSAQNRRAENLPETQISKFLESDMRHFLSLRPKVESDAEAEVIVREVHSSKETYAALPRMKTLYPDADLAKGYEYVLRVLFAFKKVDGHDVAFFAMRMLEIGENAPPSIRNTVVLDYLDTVRVGTHTPTTSLLQRQFIRSYWDFARTVGYTGVHIWANAPSFGDDFIFPYHPETQMYLSQPRLEAYYNDLIETAKKEGIVKDHQTIGEFRSSLTTPYDLPYLPQGLFPEELERSIEAAASNRKKATERSVMKYIEPFLRRFGSRSFKIDLLQPSNTTKKPSKSTFFHHSDFMANRKTFIDFGYDHGLEFTDERRAIYATSCLLHILFKEHDTKKENMSRKRQLDNPEDKQEVERKTLRRID